MKTYQIDNDVVKDFDVLYQWVLIVKVRLTVVHLHLWHPEREVKAWHALATFRDFVAVSVCMWLAYLFQVLVVMHDDHSIKDAAHPMN